MDEIINDNDEHLEKGGYSKCTRCGKPSHGKSRCQACLNKLASKRKKPGTKERSWQHADQALRRDRGGAGTTSGGHKTGKGNRQEIQRKMKAAEKKTGSKLSLDRKNNGRGYEAKNTRAVPQSLNRGRHHVDPKKLAAWKKRLKKSELDTASLYTLLKSKSQDNEELLNLIKSLGPDGLEQLFIDCLPDQEDFQYDLEKAIPSTKEAQKKSEELVKEATPKLESTPTPKTGLAAEVGKTHIVEIHPDIDHLYRAKGLIKENNRPYLHIGDYKKAGFPGDIIKKLPRDAHGKVTSEMIDKHIEWLPKKKVNVQVLPYTWGSQQHRPGDQIALSFQMHPEEHMKMSPEHKKLWNSIKDEQHEFYEDKPEFPNYNGENHQIGWSRIDPYSKENHWHIDEVQSDFQHKDKIENKMLSPKDAAQRDLEDYLHQYTGGSGAYWKSISDTTLKDKAEKDPHFKAMAEKHEKVVKLNQVQNGDKNHAAWQDLHDEAVKHGIVKPKEEYEKEYAERSNKSHKLLEHLSHGHDDPQHMIHSATNALARKLGVKSMSMDTPEDQAAQSGLHMPSNRSRNDDDFNRTIEAMPHHHYDLWDNQLNSLKSGEHPSLQNPNFKSALDKIGGLENLSKLANQSAGTGSSVDIGNNAENVDLDDENETMTKLIDTLSDPEVHALSEMLQGHYNKVQTQAEQGIQNANDDDDDGYYDEEPTGNFNLSKLPVHQIDSYHKRPRKLGMKEVDKNSLLGKHPNDQAEKVQYMNLHKKLQIILDLMKSLKDSRII